jgi:hypothetical protein
VVAKLYHEEVLDKRKVHCQGSRANGKGYGTSLQRPLFCVLQTSPDLGSCIGFGLSKGDLTHYDMNFEPNMLMKKV